MQRELAKAPPVGFRKAIPTTVKLDVVIRQEGRCKTCNEKLGSLADTQFDHTPAIQLRVWCEEIRDTAPASNDPDYIEAKHKDCHAVKTFGSQNKHASKRGADVTEIARTKRLTSKEIEFRNRLLSKAEEETPKETPAKGKTRWPKRSFPQRKKDATPRKGSQKGSR